MTARLSINEINSDQLDALYAERDQLAARLDVVLLELEHWDGPESLALLRRELGVPQPPAAVDWSTVTLTAKHLGVLPAPDPAAPLRAVAAAALRDGSDAALRQSPQTAAAAPRPDAPGTVPGARESAEHPHPGGSGTSGGEIGAQTGAQSLDPEACTATNTRPWGNGPAVNCTLPAGHYDEDDAPQPAETCCVCGTTERLYWRGAGSRRPYCADCEACNCGQNPCVRLGTNDPEVSATRNTDVCAAYVPPTGQPEESGCCARCGMYDWKHPAPPAVALLPCGDRPGPCPGTYCPRPADAEPERPDDERCPTPETHNWGCACMPVHAEPPDGSELTPCCGRTPFDVRADRITDDPAAVTCRTAPPAGALRDQLAEAVHATSVCEVGDPVRCGGGCQDAADAVLPVIEQHTAQLRNRAAEAEAQAELTRGELVNTLRELAELRRARALHADTERRLRTDLAAEVQKREAMEQQLASVRGLADDLRGVTGARYIADALDNILEPKEPNMAIDLNARREAYAAWLTANQIDPADVPCDHEYNPEGLTLAKGTDGARVIRYAAMLRNERGHKYHDPATDEAAKEQRETPLLVPPPDGLHVPEES